MFMFKRKSYWKCFNNLKALMKMFMFKRKSYWKCFNITKERGDNE